MMAFMAKTDWINFYQTLQDKNKRGSLAWRIWRQSYLKMSRLLSRSFSGYALLPLELNMEISNQCNLQCRMCPKSAIVQTSPRQSDVEDIRKVTERLGVKVLRFSGLGEPMMTPLFWKLADAAMLNGCRIAMVTNGTLLDDNAVIMLCGMSSMITISLDAATTETYKYIRGTDAFENLYNSIRSLCRHKSSYRMALPIIAINWVLMKSNYREIPLLVRRLREDEVRIDLIHCDPLVSYSTAMNEEVLPPETQGLKEYLDEVRNEALSAGIYFEYPYYERNRHAERPPGDSAIPSCGVLWESLFLSLHQEFLPCCEYYLNPIGSISSIDSRSAWNSKIMREARIRSLQGLPPFPYCGNCHKYAGNGDTGQMLKRASGTPNNYETIEDAIL